MSLTRRAVYGPISGFYQGCCKGGKSGLYRKIRVDYGMGSIKMKTVFTSQVSMLSTPSHGKSAVDEPSKADPPYGHHMRNTRSVEGPAV